jgi:hypothetical protein
MSEHDQSILQEFYEKLKTQNKILIKVVWGLLAILLGGSVLLFVSFGEVKTQTKVTTDLLQFVSRDYTPIWYTEGMTELFTLHTEKVVSVLRGNSIMSSDIKKIDEDFLHTIKIMQDNFARMRGGTTSTSRSIHDSAKGSSR